MDLSITMHFVMAYARVETAVSGLNEMHPEHIFLGLLKLPEMTVRKISAASENNQPIDDLQIEEDIQKVTRIFREAGIQPGSGREKLRKILQHKNPPGSGTQQIAELLAKATGRKKNQALSATELLNAILREPTKLIMTTFMLERESSDTEQKESQLQEQDINEPQANESEEGPDMKRTKKTGTKTTGMKTTGTKTGTGTTKQQTNEQKTVLLKTNGLVMSGKEGISPKSDEMQTLTDFSERIRSMRQALLAKIFGQDHAIHAFAEGIFNAGILAGVDEKRRQPRALFVFAGPSGVGKTFLAEQAAEALAIPFKRFDMSSFSDHQAHASLIGFAPSYKEARPGMLTGFVHDHPHSIVLFDEIEKAHLNTIQLFLQILDGGILHDDFLDKTISFKDTILIFTTNAGKQLYDREPKKIAAGFSRQTILNALENDVHPQTGAPLFPATICSRLATGYLIMFNHLHAHDLEKISAAELNRSFALFEKKYRIKVDADPLLPTALLLSEGGWTDARTLKAQTGLFFKNEIFKLLGAMESRRKTAFKNMESIHFSVPTAEAPETVIQLFENRSKPEVLLFGNAQLGETLRTAAPDITVINTSDVHEALKITAERDIDVVFIGIPDMPFYQMRNFFNLLRKRIPDMPIYLLTTDNTPADQDLASAFMRAGASGIRTAPDEKTQTLDDEKAQAHADEKTQAFAGEMETIVRQARRQNIATGFSAQHKTLAFETSAALVPSKKKAIIKLTNFSIRRAVQAEDNDLVLDEIEKPDTCFDDIVGARIAKEALTLFIDYLKHPRKFAALGLKPPTGVLLYGPPGTGKTLMAKAMAGESDATFIPASANALVASYRKSGSNAIRDLFKRAKRYTPAIIFIDEIEAIGRCGNSLIPGDYEKIALKILLTEMEETPVDQKRPVFVLAATNMEIGENNWGDETFDVALAHRFNSRIRMPLPDETDRKHYIQSVLAKRKNHRISERMIDYFANRSIDHSIADLESVIDMSYRLATQKNNPVTDKILEHAFESTHPGAKKYWDNEYWRE